MKKNSETQSDYLSGFYYGLRRIKCGGFFILNYGFRAESLNAGVVASKVRTWIPVESVTRNVSFGGVLIILNAYRSRRIIIFA